jgi:hypothetical protein
VSGLEQELQTEGGRRRRQPEAVADSGVVRRRTDRRRPQELQGAIHRRHGELSGFRQQEAAENTAELFPSPLLPTVNATAATTHEVLTFVFQVFLFQRLHQHRRWQEVDEDTTDGSGCGGHARVRVVHSGVDFCIQCDFVLRRHSFGRKSRPEERPLLDESGVFDHLHHRNAPQVDRVGVS